MDWIDLAQDRGPMEGSCEHGDEPSGSVKILGSSWVAAQFAVSQEGLSPVSKYVSKQHILSSSPTRFRPSDLFHSSG
jgi:hypothetical protein